MVFIANTVFMLIESEPGNHHDRFAVAVLQGEYAVGRILKSLQELLGTS